MPGTNRSEEINRMQQTPVNQIHKGLFSPIQIKTLCLSNRIVMPPMGVGMATPTGGVTDGHIQHYVARAKAHPGLIIGEVDILVNNAAVVGAYGFLWETDPNEWQQLFNINVIGMARCARAVLPAMISRRYGKILNVGSIAGGSENWASQCHEQMAYGVSKAAVIRFSECLAAQVIGYGINVNC